MESTALDGTSAAGSSPQQARACRNCAISKVKCNPYSRSENGKCERCNRLKKECLPGRLAQRKPRRPRTNRTAQLEEKLGSLVSLLTAGQTLALGLDPNSDARYMPPQKLTNDPLTTSSIHPDVRSSINFSAPQGGTLSPPSLYASSHTSNDPLPSPVFTSSANDRLQIFKDSMAPYFPFVVIPTGVTAEELRSTKPFLYGNIMMVTSYRIVSRQLQLRSEIIKSLTQLTFLHGEKSLDLLQGAIVFAAWYHQCVGPSPQLTNIVQLATALVFDLNLHRAQSPYNGFDKYAEALNSSNKRRIKPPRTLEERRAFLGLFCLSRVLSSNLGKIEPLQNTPYVEECCTEIEKQQEYSSDQYLVFQARLENVADAAIRSFPLQNAEYWSNMGTEPICMLVKSFERDLERFKNTLEPELLQSSLFQIHLLSVSIHNTEIALRKSSMAERTQLSSNPARLALLLTCLKSTQTFFREWLLLPSSLYHHLPITVFALVGHAVIVLGMLNLFQDDDWDLDYVREIAPFSLTIDKLAQKYEEASREVDTAATSGCSVFSKSGLKMKKIRDWYNMRLARPASQEERGNGNLDTLVDAATRDVISGLDMDMEVLDDGFWNEMVSWMAYNEVV